PEAEASRRAKLASPTNTDTCKRGGRLTAPSPCRKAGRRAPPSTPSTAEHLPVGPPLLARRGPPQLLPAAGDKPHAPKSTLTFRSRSLRAGIPGPRALAAPHAGWEHASRSFGGHGPRRARPPHLRRLAPDRRVHAPVGCREPRVLRQVPLRGRARAAAGD